MKFVMLSSHVDLFNRCMGQLEASCAALRKAIKQEKEVGQDSDRQPEQAPSGTPGFAAGSLETR